VLSLSLNAFVYIFISPAPMSQVTVLKQVLISLVYIIFYGNIGG
jgi:hypothetical protein